MSRMTPEERFWSKVKKGDGCWEWQARLNAGYGVFTIGKKKLKAHRYAWELLRGPIPDNMTIDHLCRNRCCVNPDHLEPVPLRLNIMRVLQGPDADGSKCVNGHEFTEWNTLIRETGSRSCRICAYDRTRDYLRNRRAKEKRETEA